MRCDIRRNLGAATAALGLLLANGGSAAEPPVLWQIGAPDRGNAEFALAPADFAKFAEDGFFVVGVSKPGTAWPYVHPGPEDAWAGGRAHTFTVVFGVGAVPAAEGNCRLVLDLLDTHYGHAPQLTIEINGRAFERALPKGAGDESVHGQPAKGRPHQCVVEFPVSLLHAGANQVLLTVHAGSWLLYDAVTLETPAGVAGAPVENLTVLRSVRTTPAVVERDGRLYQPLELTLLHTGAALEAEVRVDGRATAASRCGRACRPSRRSRRRWSGPPRRPGNSPPRARRSRAGRWISPRCASGPCTC